jgi:hypothetical protein
MNEQYIKELINKYDTQLMSVGDGVYGIESSKMRKIIQEAMKAQREACADEVINELVACELDLPTLLINHLRNKALNAEVKE